MGWDADFFGGGRGVIGGLVRTKRLRRANTSVARNDPHRLEQFP
jgi:hypothetical protein